MPTRGWQGFLGTLQDLVLGTQVFNGPRHKDKLLRAGTNVTIVEDIVGYVISATSGGGGVAPESDQAVLPGRAFDPQLQLAPALPNDSQGLLAARVFLPQQAKPQDLRAGSNVTLARDAAGVVISATGGGGSASLTTVTLTAPYNVQEWTETIADASVSLSSKIQVGWGATSSTDENEPTMDALTFSAVPGSGTLTITAASDGLFGGPLKLCYLVGT